MKLFDKIKQKHADMTPERRAKWYTLYSIVTFALYVCAVIAEPAIFILTLAVAFFGLIIYGIYRAILSLISPQRPKGW